MASAKTVAIFFACRFAHEPGTDGLKGLIASFTVLGSDANPALVKES
jgi:hypothetical protein